MRTGRNPRVLDGRNGGIDEEPLDQPVMLGLVRFDGADTVLLHRLLLEKRGEPTIGERVRAVFAPEREGSMLDVEGFAPADGGTGP